MKKRNELFEILGNTVSSDGSVSNGTGATWSAGVAFKRAAGVPLEKYSLFKTLEEAKNYAKGNPVAYAGQPVAILDADEKTATLYLIQQDASLSEVGSVTLGDGETIDLDVESKKLSLHDFGKYYYAFSTDSEGNSHYTKTAITEENKAKLAGLEARIAQDGDNYVLAWYEPNTTTVEGVSKELASLKTTVQNNSNILTGDTSVAGSVNKRIADAIAGVSQFKYEKVDELPETGVVGTIYLKKHTVGEAVHYDEYLYLDGAWEEIGALDDIDLSGYYTKTEADEKISDGVKGETDRAKGIESGLDTRVSELENAGYEANKVNDVKVKTGEADAATVVSGKVATIDLTGYATKAALNTVDEKITDSSTGLLKRVSDAETAISTINSTTDGILAKAKSYTDDQITSVDGKITTVKESIGTIPTDSTVMAEIEKKVSTTDFESFKTSNTTAIGNAKSEAISTAGTNADSKIKAATGELGTKEVDGAQVAKTVKDYVDEQVTAAAPSDYATVKADVKANKEAIAAINNETTGILAKAKEDATSKVNRVLGTADDTATDKTVYGAIAAATEAKNAADGKIAAVKGDDSITVSTANHEATVSVKISEAEGNLLKLDSDGLKVIHKDAPEYGLTKLANAESGFAATYKLTKDGTEIGDSINIPKDYVVKSAELKVCATVNVPVEGFAVGDKYIDFVINTEDATDGTTGEKHIYLNVKDLVDVYTAGNGVVISAKNVVSAKVVAANGLSVGTNGIAMATAGKDAEGDGYHAGAMTAEQAEKLAGVSAGANANVIEGILDGEGEELTVTSKKVKLPMATATKLGLVKGSIGANHVQIGDDGTMTVASINASSLISDRAIRINGGNASSDFSTIDA